jgi:hypothetical protein
MLGVGATAISLMARLIFDPSFPVMENIFLEGRGEVTMHPSCVPNRDSMAEWARRLKGRHPRLKKFRFVVEYSAFNIDATDFPEDNKLLVFDYNEEDVTSATPQPSLLGGSSELQDHRADVDEQYFRYTTYP